MFQLRNASEHNYRQMISLVIPEESSGTRTNLGSRSGRELVSFGRELEQLSSETSSAERIHTLDPEESSGIRSVVCPRQRNWYRTDDTKKRPKKRATLSSHSNFSLSSL